MQAFIIRLSALACAASLMGRATSAHADPEALAERLKALTARPGGITEREVGRGAAKHSSEARARRAEIAVAQAEVDKAVVEWFPRVTLTARYTRLSPIEETSLGPSQGNLVVTPAGEGPLPPGAPLVGVPASALSFPVILDQYTLQANLTVPISDYLLRVGQGHKAALHSRASAELMTKAARRNSAFEGKLAYFSWVGARLENEIAKESLVQSKTHLESAKALSDVGRASPADVLEAESRVAGAELLVERTKNLARLDEERLRTIVRDTSGRRYEIGDDFDSRVPDERADFSSLYAEALRRRPELRALDRSSSSLAEQKKAVHSSAYPRLDAFGNAYYANPNQRYVPQREEWKATWDVGVQLSWTPNAVATSSATARGLEAQRERNQAQKQQLADALRTEVFDALSATREAKVALATSARSLTASEEAYRVRLEQYKLGRASNVELSDAESSLLRARIEHVRAKVSIRAARARLDHAVGR